MSEEGYGAGQPATMGPPARAQTGTPLDADIEILDADAALPAVMSALSAFLSHASLEAGDNQASAGADALQMMTVHSAKGLEFDNVFITGLEEGLFPHESSAKEDNGVEEERRLMYVAITRARNRLYMSFAQTRMLHGQTRYNMKSRFFDELPEASLKWLSTKVQAHWSPKSAWDVQPLAMVSVGSDNAVAQKIAQKIAQKAASGPGWRIGESVVHVKFGEGVIVNLEGGGSNARAQINFGQYGMKVLDLSIAKLERLG